MSVNGTQHDVGILLTNVGSPAAPTTRAVRAYLRQFLADPMVVDAPRWKWWLIRNLIVLPFRAPKSARLYRSIWTERGSPLVVTTELQATALRAELRHRSSIETPVVAAMRYGGPSLEAGLRRLATGCRTVVVLPLFPQFSHTTVTTTREAVDVAKRRVGTSLELRTVVGYHDHPSYIHALAKSIREAAVEGDPPRHLVMSFHGLPQRYVDAGDPYADQCRYSARLLAGEIGLESGQWTMCYQSRFGREEWLRPSTDETLHELGRAGCPAVDVVCPGFAADCLETLEEIAVEGRRTYEEAGGTGFRYIPALNDRPEHISALADIVEPLLG
jgi:ferrochelatase